MTDTGPTLAILGGTGDLGWGLAVRWLNAGYDITIGSRAREKAEDAASKLTEFGFSGTIIHQISIE